MRRQRSRGWVVLTQTLILPLLVLGITAANWPAGTPLSGGARSPAPVVEQAYADSIAPTSSATGPAPTATATPSPTPSPVPSPTPTQTASPNPTSSPSPSPTSAPSPTPTDPPSPTPTSTPIPTPTPPCPAPDGAQRVLRVPILMYHRIDTAPAGADAIRRDLSVAPSAFEEQLRYLKQEGYQGISLGDLVSYLAAGRPLPEKPIVLTFDDGYRDNYAHAFPLLRLFDYTATFFLVTAPIDREDPDFLSWEQVKEMHAAGMQFEPHSYDHPDLRGRTFDFLVFQILASQHAIEARTGVTCRFFAYPSGRYDQFVIDVLRSADYCGAALTEQGATHSSDGLFELRRVRVQGGDDLELFIRKLKLDW